MAQIDFANARFPEMYEGTVVAPIFRPWVPTLFEKAQLSDGQSVLDVACGTGIVSRMAKAKLGQSSRVVGVDLSPAMLTLAQSIAPTVEFRTGNAQDLPLGADEAFDTLFCSQGMQFFPDKAKAASEMKRALKPNGRMAMAAWSPADAVPFYRELQDVVEQHVGTIADHRYSFGIPDSVATLLRDAGFRDVHAETMSKSAHLEDQQSFVRTNAIAMVGMSSAAAEMDGDTRAQTIAAIINDSSPVVQRYADGDGITFDMKTVIAWAQK
jgi:ubiquinone/menaquinone biosynthesis C-methylase UbiE